MARSLPPLPTLASLALPLAGCDAASEAAQSLAIIDPARSVALVEILCDPSIGSTCTRDAVDSLLLALSGPGAHGVTLRLRLWGMGRDIADTRLLTVDRLGAGVSGRPRGGGDQGSPGYDEFRSYLDQEPPDRTPLVESIAKIAHLYPLRAAKGILIIVGDGLEESDLASFECAPLPDPEAFLKKVEEAGLVPGALVGRRVVFAFNDWGPIDGHRCPVKVDRMLEVRELWTAAVIGAGAEGVDFFPRAPDPQFLGLGR